MRRGDWKRYSVGVTIAAMWGVGAGLAGRGDYEDALVRDAIRKDPPQSAYLTHPVKTIPTDCDMLIEQNGLPPRCYYFREKKNVE